LPPLAQVCREFFNQGTQIALAWPTASDRTAIYGLRDRPIVFVEVLAGADETGLTSLLGHVRYVDLVMRPTEIIGPHREVRHDALGWNHIWLPEERVSVYLEVAMASVGCD